MKDNRREFIKKGGALAALSLVGIGAGNSGISAATTRMETKPKDLLKSQSGKPLMKIAFQAPSEPEEIDLKFIQQMGIDHVVLNTDGTKSSYEYYNSRRQIYDAAGIKVYGFGN